MKIRPVTAELFHVDRRTDRHHEANSLFRNSLNAPKNKDKISGSVCDTLTLIDRYTTYGNKTVLSMSTGLKKIRRELKFAMSSCPWA
jgi:hypothetical protein